MAQEFNWLSPKGPSEDGQGEGSLWQKLGWFVGLCVAGAGVVAITAYILRGLLFL